MTGTLDTLTAIFSHLCGRQRCFFIDGQALPLCQRCLGLYTGAALTAVWLLASGLRRRGLPPRRLLPLHLTLILAAMAGGLRLIDIGPTWRVLCGLWTGHVLLLWLHGGARHLACARHDRPLDTCAWTAAQQRQAILAAALLSAIGIAIPHFLCLGGVTWGVIALAGAVTLAVALLHAVSQIAAPIVNRLFSTAH